MKKSSISGWKDVFSFTLNQTLKSKSFIVSFIVMLVICVGVMPVLSMVLGNGKEDEPSMSKILKVYVNDTTKLSDTGFLPTVEDQYYKQIDFVPMNEDYDALLDRIDKKETTSVVLDVTANENGYFELHFTKSSNGEVTKNDTQTLGGLVLEDFNTYIMNVTGVTQDQIDFINSETVTKVTAADVNGNEIVEEDTSISMAQYWFIYGLFFVVLMVINLASTQIASSIAGDKSTRVVEYLLTSVKPLALMVGKILAMLVAVVGQTIVLIIGAVVSNKVTAMVLLDGGESILEQYLPDDIFASLNLVNVIICLVVVALGLIFCGTLAGLAGATVSKIEELNEGLTLFMVVNMVGAYMGIIAAGVLSGDGMNSFVIFALLCPISAPYLLPGAILVGKVSFLMATGAILHQIIFIVLLMSFVAKVYETLILHNGNTVSFKALLKLSKSLKKEAK
jgi:ABC-2 type transport system permease protein